MKEIRIPIAVNEVFEDDSPRFVVCRAQVPIVAKEAYVDGEVYSVEKDIFAPLGTFLWLPLPKNCKHVRGARAGIFARQVDEAGKVVSACPVAGEVVGVFRATSVTITPKGGQRATFSPDFLAGTTRPVAFKRLDLRCTTKEVVIENILVGTTSIFYAEGGIPLEMATREGAFDKTAVIGPGVMLTLVLANRGEEEAIVEGDIVFEEVSQKSAGPKIIAPS